MTWYEDLGPIDYSGVDESVPLRAVGWLEHGHDFRRGRIGIDVFRKLRELFRHAYQPVISLGFHECDLCRFRPNIGRPQFGSSPGAQGSANIWVPASDCLYVAPELVIHYIDAHHYLPPKEFLDAIAACPDTLSMAYGKALGASGGRVFLRSWSQWVGEFQKHLQRSHSKGI